MSEERSNRCGERAQKNTQANAIYAASARADDTYSCISKLQLQPNLQKKDKILF